jgi:nitrate/nitrite transporter NarK
MIAIPVLLGSLGRIPAGIFTDRFGARNVFSVLLAFGIIPAIALAFNHSYASLLFWGFFLGIAGSSFAIGIAFVSRWYPPKYQGMACGIYGAGNIGQFDLTPTDAGMRTALFVIIATCSRPVGGWLSDRLGGTTLLLGVFLGIVATGWLMAIISIIPFTLGALSCAILFGLGNGAVFKLVPQYFPQQVGTVTGLVGAAGGLGGFFPPPRIRTISAIIR